MIRLLLLFLTAIVSAQELPPVQPVHPLSPAESIARVQLPAGYRLESVLSEPHIAEPVAIAFDGDGRMFVVEMRTYMQDIDGTGEHQPASRVSLHEDTDGDGIYDKHTVFADRLLLPRMVLPIDKGRALIGETDTSDIDLWTDADGDGVAEKKEKWYQGGPRGGNMEHQPSGLIWSVDNWIYTTYNAFRLRWTPGGAVLKEPTAPNGGQWGVSQDNWGKPWFVNAGGEIGPLNFQVPIVYGAFHVPGQFEPGFDVVWPALGLPDVQGGPARYRPEDGTLNHFTATCGGEIYRGDRLPAELRGNLFFGEPVGRLVRRTRVEVREGLTYLSNPHERSEFLRSTDPLFRPVQMANAPDGTLYIVDMYRGIIQEGEWVQEGSYLRKVAREHQLDKQVGMGRIFRLVHDTTRREAAPQMNGEPAAALVAHLAHPNGWWRDTAQKLLIVKQDRSVLRALSTMAAFDPEPLARLHALWTLEGLEGLEAALVRTTMNDPHPQVRSTAIRLCESLVKKGDGTFTADLHRMVNDLDPGVVLQAMLTARLLRVRGHDEMVSNIAGNASLPGPRQIASQMVVHPESVSPSIVSIEHRKSYDTGKGIYESLCASCHAPNGQGMPMAGAGPGAMLAPSFRSSKTLNGPSQGPIYILLHGLTGEIDGARYEGQMASMGTNDDAWIADVLNYVRNSFGNKGGFIAPAEIANARTAMKDRTKPWTIAELRAHLPQETAPSEGENLDSASSSSGSQ